MWFGLYGVFTTQYIRIRLTATDPGIITRDDLLNQQQKAAANSRANRLPTRWSVPRSSPQPFTYRSPGTKQDANRALHSAWHAGLLSPATLLLLRPLHSLPAAGTSTDPRFLSPVRY